MNWLKMAVECPSIVASCSCYQLSNTILWIIRIRIMITNWIICSWIYVNPLCVESEDTNHFPAKPAQRCVTLTPWCDWTTEVSQTSHFPETWPSWHFPAQHHTDSWLPVSKHCKNRHLLFFLLLSWLGFKLWASGFSWLSRTNGTSEQQSLKLV